MPASKEQLDALEDIIETIGRQQCGSTTAVDAWNYVLEEAAKADTSSGPAEFLSFADVATLARVSESKVRRWHKRKLLPALRPPGTKTVLFERGAIVAWLRGRAAKRGGR